MAWHWILIAPFSIVIKDISRKDFKDLYQKADPHRPRWAEKLTGKRVRLYELIAKKWITCCLKYNGEGIANIDCSATMQTDDKKECMKKLKKYVIKHCKIPKSYWDGYCLDLNTLMICIECSDPQSEGVEEEICTVCG